MKVNFYRCRGDVESCKPNEECFLTTNPGHARSLDPIGVHDTVTGDGLDELIALPYDTWLERELAKPEEKRMPCKRSLAAREGTEATMQVVPD